MSGLMEILIIIVIILGIFMLPRMLNRQPESEIRPVNQNIKLSGWQRIAILVSILWAAFFTLYLKPWKNDWPVFIYVGLGPVIFFWGIFWIYLGFKKKNK